MDQKGFSITIFIVVVALIFVGGTFYVVKEKSQISTPTQVSQEPQDQPENFIEKNNVIVSTPFEDFVVINKAQQNQTRETFSLSLGESKKIKSTTILLESCSNRGGVQAVLMDKTTSDSHSVSGLGVGDSMDSVGQSFDVLTLQSLSFDLKNDCTAQFEYKSPSSVALPIGDDLVIKPGMQWIYKGVYLYVQSIGNSYSEQVVLLKERIGGGGSQISLIGVPYGPTNDVPEDIGGDKLLFKLISTDLVNHSAKIKITKL